MPAQLCPATLIFGEEHQMRFLQSIAQALTPREAGFVDVHDRWHNALARLGLVAPVFAQIGAAIGSNQSSPHGRSGSRTDCSRSIRTDMPEPRPLEWRRGWRRPPGLVNPITPGRTA